MIELEKNKKANSLRQRRHKAEGKPGESKGTSWDHKGAKSLKALEYTY
jgi:hypothetical protein